MKQKEYIEPSPAEYTETKSANTAQVPQYQKPHQVDLLRFITAGSVDDGKSTLIGRLMYDTKSIFEDQLKAIEASSKKRGDAQVDLALLTDGLKAEREQGITIDVAYRYFSTPKRKFIMADTPGHIEYTRNMFTGASTADAVIILIDARHGVIEQTRRHTFIASLLGIRHIIVAINKMDLVDFDQKVFEKIKEEYQALIASTLSGSISIGSVLTGSISKNKHELHFIPISALHGDNVVDISKHTPWYKGDTVLKTLESVDVHSALNVDPHSLMGANADTYKHPNDINQNAGTISPGRFPIQRVIRPHSAEFPDFRGYAGRVEGGVFRPGETVKILPSGKHSTIDKIYSYKTKLEIARKSDSVVITLTDDVDVSRGDILVTSYDFNANNDLQIKSSNEIEATLNWFSEKPLRVGSAYTLKHTTREIKAIVQSVLYEVDINSIRPIEGRADYSIIKNAIARVKIKTSKPLYFDTYSENKVTGSFILIDEFTHETSAAGVII